MQYGNTEFLTGIQQHNKSVYRNGSHMNVMRQWDQLNVALFLCCSEIPPKATIF